MAAEGIIERPKITAILLHDASSEGRHWTSSDSFTSYIAKFRRKAVLPSPSQSTKLTFHTIIPCPPPRS